jgi:hypothetical protein
MKEIEISRWLFELPDKKCCQMTSTLPINLNYYFSSAVCAVSVRPSVCGSVCPKNTFEWLHLSKNVSIQSCQIFKKNKNGRFIFDFFWIRSVQNGSYLIKLDQIGFPH